MARAGRCTLERIDEIDSTSSELLRRGEAGVALLARRQTVGRGRLGRPWQSLDGNLNLSVALGVPVPRHPGHWSLLAAVTLLETLRAVAPGRPEFGLKWPNDVMLSGRKLGGVLLELAPGEAGQALLVIGFGVNLAAAPALDRPVAILAETGATPGADAVAQELLARLDSWINRYEAEGFEPIRLAWLAAGHQPGEVIPVKTGVAVLEGRFAGLAPDGALLLDQGSRRMTITSGEVGIAPGSGQGA